MIEIEVNGTLLEAELSGNVSSEALEKMLSQGPLTLSMRDYAGMEKVGSLGRNLPACDRPIHTEAGDIILYQGRMLVFYYDQNSWSLTRLGKIRGKSASELRKIFGTGDIRATLRLKEA